MSVHHKTTDGNWILYDSSEPQRYVEAFGPDVCKFIEEFVNTPFATDAPAGWATTLVEAGGGETTVALEVGTGVGGVLKITADENEDDGANLQALGEAFLLASGKECYFGVRFNISEATESDFLMGLCITDTDLLGGMTDGVYFRKPDGGTTMSFVLEKDSSETATAYGSAITAAAWHVAEFYFNGTNVDWYVDGVIQTRPVVTNLPDDAWLTPSIQFLNGAAGAGKTFKVDWIRAIQINA